MTDPQTLIDATLAFWQTYASHPLSAEDARQIIENAAGFFSVLARWERQRQEGADDAVSQSSSEDAP